VIEYNGIRWYRYQGALLPRVPPHREVRLTPEEQRELLAESGALFLRYTSEWKRPGGEFWYVIKESFGGMEELSANTRSKVRRGEKRNEVKMVDAETIAEKGYEVYRRAFEAYETFIRPVGAEEFAASVFSKKDREFWGVFDRASGKLVAYSENFIEEETCHYSTIKFHPDYLRNYTSYILFYAMNRYYLEEKGLRYVNDGARSISHETDVQKFLMEKFGFVKAHVRMEVAYRRDVALAVKLLYPLAGMIARIDHPAAKKISVVLTQEKIRRSFG